MKAIITFITFGLLCIVVGSFLATFISDDVVSVLQVLPSFDLLLIIAAALFLVLVWITGVKPRFVVFVFTLAVLNFIGHNGVPDPFSCSGDGDKRYRLVSLNVAQFDNDTAVVAEIVDKLRKLDADVILLQEFGLYYKWPDVASVKEDFAERLNMPHAEFSPNPGNIFGTGVFSKHPIKRIDALFQMLSHTNEAKRYVIAFPTRDVSITNVHLMSYNLFATRTAHEDLDLSKTISKRLTQAETVLSHPSDFIVGDFNASPGTVVYGRFSKLYTDAFKGRLASTHKLLWTRLDHVFYEPEWCVPTAQILHGFPLDHKGLLIEFQFVE